MYQITAPSGFQDWTEERRDIEIAKYIFMLGKLNNGPDPRSSDVRDQLNRLFQFRKKLAEVSNGVETIARILSYIERHILANNPDDFDRYTVELK